MRTGPDWRELRAALYVPLDDTIPFATSQAQQGLAVWDALKASRKRFGEDFQVRDGVSIAWLAVQRAIENYPQEPRGRSLRDHAVRTAILSIRQAAVYEHWKCGGTQYQRLQRRKRDGVPMPRLSTGPQAAYLAKSQTYEDSSVANEDAFQILWQRATADCSHRDRTIAYLRLVEEKTLEHISEVFNLSTQRISQIILHLRNSLSHLELGLFEKDSSTSRVVPTGS